MYMWKNQLIYTQKMINYTKTTIAISATETHGSAFLYSNNSKIPNGVPTRWKTDKCMSGPSCPIAVADWVITSTETTPTAPSDLTTSKYMVCSNASALVELFLSKRKINK